MTWGEFRLSVREHLTVHNRRQGIQSLIDTLIKAALLDLQSAIPALRTGQSSVYGPSRFTADGFAGKARLTAGVLVTRAYVRDPSDRSVQYDLTPVYSDREEEAMVRGLTAQDERLISLRAGRGEFRVVPNPMQDGGEVVIVWDGTKVDFEDSDDVPESWDLRVALAVSDFVHARVTRKVDQDPALAESYAGSYTAGKRKLKSDWNEASLVAARKKRS